MTARGLRNFNPGNLRRSKDKWQGLAARQTDKEFFVFESAVYGIRALARTLINYQDKYNLRTVAKIINRWAPPKENNTKAYVASVAKFMDVSPTEELDLHTWEHLKPFVCAIIKHENGQQPYTDAQIDRALVMAGVEVKRGLAKSRTVNGATVAATGTAGTAALEAVTNAQSAVGPLTDYLDIAKYIMLALVVIGVGITVYAKWDSLRRLGA